MDDPFAKKMRSIKALWLISMINILESHKFMKSFNSTEWHFEGKQYLKAGHIEHLFLLCGLHLGQFCSNF